MTSAPNHPSQHDLIRLGRVLRTAPRFTDVVHWWAGYPVHSHRSTVPCVEPLSDDAAVLADLAPGTPVLRRDIYLAGAAVGPVEEVAAITELVYEPLLGSHLATRHAVRDGTQPLEALLDGLHRAVYLITRGGSAEASALTARSILSCAGRPIALTTETVHTRLLTHQPPATLPQYAARVPSPVRVAP